MAAEAQSFVQDLCQRVLKAEPRAIARAMRIIDDRRPEFVELLRALHPHTGHAYVLGITGTPGAGKSTLVDRIIETYRAQKKRVGVVAVDPTSPFTGGAILGDRIRMQRHFLDEDVFIRSLATRGHLGGLSRSAADVIRVLDAARFDVIIVETVGVGQDELEVARLADTTVVVVPPGLGDDIQAIKAGILEVAHIFAVNKADRDGADTTVRDLEQMIALGDSLIRAAAKTTGHSAAIVRMTHEDGKDDGTWHVPVMKTVATKKEGVAELIAECDRHRAFLATSDAGSVQRVRRRGMEFDGVFLETVLRGAREQLGDALVAARDQVSRDGEDPYAVVERLAKDLFAKGNP